MIFRKYICLIITLWVSVSSVNATVVKVFDVGQGSCVAVKQRGKVLLVDAGSSERTYLAAYQQGSQAGKIYDTRGMALKLEEEIPESALEKTFQAGAGAGSAPASQSPSSEDSVSPSDVAVATSKALTQQLKSSIRQFIEDDEVDEIVVVATHADQDHVRWLPQLLDDTFKRIDRLKAVVLSGFSNEYDSTLGQWLARIGAERIIYTGTFTGKAGYPKSLFTPWSLKNEMGDYQEESPEVSASKRSREEETESLFARFYHSGIVDKTDCEKRIEEALHFGSTLTVEILSMNSGMAMDRVKLPGKLGEACERWHLSRANIDSNANSLVLRIASKGENGKSILIPGDADETTWSRIAAQGKVAPVTYMVLSHHGSQEQGATSRALLKIFRPRAFLVSAGHHKGYHHPALSVMEICRKYLNDNFPRSHKVEDHAITYFRSEQSNGKTVFTYRRRLTKQPIFSTITQGTMKINLEEGEKNDIKIEASRDRSRLFAYEEGGRKTLFLASGRQVFKNEEEGLGTLLEKSAGKIILFEEKEPDLEAAKEDTLFKLLQGKKVTQGIKEILEGEDAALETEDRYYVLRKKNEHIFVYNVLPYEEDPPEL